ncbi:MAG: AAA family ATPase [Clostridia bacterium]|nr:AAA family ATPase [Clostridia bacterium]
MKEYDDFNVSRDVMEAMISAASISNELLEPEVSSMDLVIASLTFPDNKLYEFLEKHNPEEYLDPNALIIAIMGSKQIYEEIMQENYENFLELKRATSKEINIVLKNNLSQELANITTFNLDYSPYLVCTPTLEQALLRAKEVDKAFGRNSIQLDTLLYCILIDKTSKANLLVKRFFKGKGIVNYLKNEVVGNSNKLLTTSKVELPDTLKTFVTDLNSEFSKVEKCDILGRDDEIFQVWNIMSKKTKRNAILIGEPGVGKTAIVEAITYSIVKGTCPEEFKDYTVYSLNLNGMVAGTKYRGEFEEKTQRLIEFLESTDKVIIFLDEIHHLLGTGSAEGSGPDLSGSLKPLLARDNVVFIGATTTDEYNRIFARDGALSRRFEIVVIKEPKFNEVKSMISARVERLSNYHNVKVSDKMLDNILVCASSFSNVSNPDRSIDLLDKSMAVAKMNKSKELKMEHIKRVYRRNFERYEKMPTREKRRTAYHEAGHFVMWYLSKTKCNQDCVLVSIIPAQHWLGVNIFEYNEFDRYSTDINFLRERVAVDLGGRIAQSFVSKEFDSGASSDLNKATSTVEKFIMEYGMDEKYLNYSFNTKSKLGISDKTSDEIRQKTMAFVNETYKKTENILVKNRRSLENVAKLLMQKGIVTKEEAIEAFNKAPKTPKKTSKKEKVKEAK